MTFISEVYMLRLRALDYIRKIVTNAGDNPYELIEPDLADEKDDEFYNLPQQIASSERYGNIFYDNYSIIEVKMVDDKLVFEGTSTYGEADETDKTFEEDDLNTEVLCGIADKIADLEK